jgi:hypothetical protein
MRTFVGTLIKLLLVAAAGAVLGVLCLKIAARAEAVEPIRSRFGGSPANGRMELERLRYRKVAGSCTPHYRCDA